MASQSFCPAEVLEIYCRFCKKTLPAQLERSIAGSGRIVDKASTFEYICSRCHRPHCFHGNDIISEPAPPALDEPENELKPRPYLISEHYLIGEKIMHPSYDCPGTIVGKYPGNPNRLFVKFEKIITTLVEDVN
jgi:hypothetical protein